MLAFNARPPDPAIVGDRWRELWLERLEGNVDLIETWLEPPGARRLLAARLGLRGLRRDRVPGARGRRLGRRVRRRDLPAARATSSCPRRALVGPWGHQWPQEGRPGPAIGFLQEAVRWWDHWLKGIDNGVMEEPMLRAWMQEAVAPATDYDERPGRWVAEPAWPPADDRQRRSSRSSSTRAALHAQRAAHGRTRALGTAARRPSAWTPAPGARTATRPTCRLDQRRDDALSLSPRQRSARASGSSCSAARTAAAGRRRPAGRRSSSRGCATSRPTARSTLITRGVLNLCHREGHDQPRALDPGERGRRRASR